MGQAQAECGKCTACNDHEKCNPCNNEEKLERIECNEPASAAEFSHISSLVKGGPASDVDSLEVSPDWPVAASPKAASRDKIAELQSEIMSLKTAAARESVKHVKEKRDSQKEKKEARISKTKEDSLRRPAFDVLLERSGKHWRNLGILVSSDDDPKYITIDDVWEPSLMSEWNKAHDEDQQVGAGDTIVSVNGSSCNGEDMIAKIKGVDKFEAVQLRIAGLEHSNWFK